METLFAHKFKIRCSAIHMIMASMKPTKITAEELAELNHLKQVKDGKALTDKGNAMAFTAKREARLNELIDLQKNPRKAELPAGAKTYALNWLHDKIYGRNREFSAEETEKGNRTEQDGFDLIKEYLGDDFMREHPDRVRGEFIEGECDIMSPSVLYDNKSAFTHETMPLLTEKVKRAHWCQLQGYGHLYGYKWLGRAYTLTNMPMDMIEKKAFYATKAKHGPDFYEYQHQEILEQFIHKYTYDDLPLELRVIISEFDYQPEFIESVIERVKMMREYIAELEKQIPQKKLDAIIQMIKVRKAEKEDALNQIKNLPKGAKAA